MCVNSKFDCFYPHICIALLWVTIDVNFIHTILHPGIEFHALRTSQRQTAYAFRPSRTSRRAIACLTCHLHFYSRVFNKVKSRSAHMKSHRPIPLPDSTGQESKRPVIQQPSKVQQPQQLSTPQQQSQQQQQQQQKPDNPIPQAQDHQQQVPVNVSDNSVQNSTHVWHNPTRLRPP